MNYYYYEWELEDEVVSFEIIFDYNPGTPDVPYLPNGDPGYPGDPPEVDIVRIDCLGVLGREIDEKETKQWEEKFRQEGLTEFLMEDLYKVGAEGYEGYL